MSLFSSSSSLGLACANPELAGFHRESILGSLAYAPSGAEKPLCWLAGNLRLNRKLGGSC